MFDTRVQSDVCLICEGTYPYVTGGVASWIHDFIVSNPQYTFAIASIVPENKSDLEIKYILPSNVTEVYTIGLYDLHTSLLKKTKALSTFLHKLEPHLKRLQTHEGHASDIAGILDLFKTYKHNVHLDALLNSPESFELLKRMYRSKHAGFSFLDYFWTWRSLHGGLFNLLSCDYPDAKLYHTLSTGYAGLLGARATLETGSPLILSEHGIYSNERNIELLMADWLHENKEVNMNIEETERQLRSIWINIFYTFGKACYEAAARVTTLYGYNQHIQVEHGADPEKCIVIPNGVDYEKYSAIQRKSVGKPTVAMIGRVVPIKDIKTFIRSIAVLKTMKFDCHVLIMGPEDEDKEYAEECKDMVKHFELSEMIEFTGRVDIAKYFERIDCIVLTSVSEAQPLVILEAGAAGIPSVATDVGSCRELIEGIEGDDFGHGGIVVPLADPHATAEAIAKVLYDKDFYQAASKAIQKRVETFYNKPDILNRYRAVYDKAWEDKGKAS